MNIKKRCLIIAFAAVSAVLIASSITSMEKRLYELCRINGAAPPSSFSPWTPRELELSIPEDTNNKTELLHDLVQEAFSPSANAFAWSVPLNLNLELYLKSNQRYSWENRLPILDLPVNFSFWDTVLFRSGFVLKQRKSLTTYDVPFSINMSTIDLYQCEYFWPYRAFVQVNTSWFGLTAGRIPMHIGPGKTGSLLVSNNVNFYDAILMKFFNRMFEFSTSVQFFPSETEMGIGNRTFEMMILHRFEFVAFRKARIAITESIMYTSQVFDIRFLNPMVVYHQYFTDTLTNSILSMDFDWNIVKGLGLYGQIVMDQYQLREEEKFTPDAFGYQVGLEYSAAVAQGILSFWFEFTHADPWLYHRDGVDYVTWFRYREGYEKKYVGYPLGGDTQVWALGMEYDNLKWIAGKFVAAYVRKGEIGIDADFETQKKRSDRTPTGIPENDLSFDLKVEVGPLLHMKLFGGLIFNYTMNYKHVTGITDMNIQGNIGLSFVL